MIAIIRIVSEEEGNKLRDFVAAHRKGGLISDYIVEHREELQSAIEGKGRLLYLTRLARKARRGDLSLLVHMNEPNELAEFIANHIGGIEGITSIWVVNLYKPIFYPLPKDTKRFKRYVVTLNCVPQQASSIYETLVESDMPRGTAMAYLGYSYSSFGESIQFSVLAEHDEAVKSYLSDTISPMPGVKRTHLFPIEMTRPLVSYDEWKDYSATHGIITSWDDEHMLKQFEDWQKAGLPKKSE